MFDLPFQHTDDLPNDIANLENPIPFTIVNAAPLDNTAFIAPYVPINTTLLNDLFTFACLNFNDTLMDLGCGDGRIVLSATFGINIDITSNERTRTTDKPGWHRPRVAYGVDLDPYVVAFAQKRLKVLRESAGQNECDVRIWEGDMYGVELGTLGVTVMILYLLPGGLGTLRDMFREWLESEQVGVDVHVNGDDRKCHAGKRIVTVEYQIPEWQPAKVKVVHGGVEGRQKAATFYWYDRSCIPGVL